MAACWPVLGCGSIRSTAFPNPCITAAGAQLAGQRQCGRGRQPADRRAAGGGAADGALWCMGWRAWQVVGAGWLACSMPGLGEVPHATLPAWLACACCCRLALTAPRARPQPWPGAVQGAGAGAEDQGVQQRGPAARRRRPGGRAGGRVWAGWAARGCMEGAVVGGHASLPLASTRPPTLPPLPPPPPSPSSWWPRPSAPSGCPTRWRPWRRRWAGGRGRAGSRAGGRGGQPCLPSCCAIRGRPCLSTACRRRGPAPPALAAARQVERFEADLEALGPARGRNRPPRWVGAERH